VTSVGIPGDGPGTESALDELEEVADEVDQDSLNFAVALAEAADDAKAAGIRVLYVGPEVGWTEYVLIATVYSKPQLDAVAFRLGQVAERFFLEEGARGVAESTERGTWTAIDLGTVVAHLMTPEQREYYDLDERYDMCGEVELPFEGEAERPGY